MTTHENDLPASAVTEVSPVLARLLVAAFFAVLLAVPIFRHAVPEMSADPFAPFITGAAAAHDGGTGFFTTSRRLQREMDTFERTLEEESEVLAVSLPPVQWLLAGWGGAGNESAYVGRPGWLVYRPGYDALVGRPFLDPDVLEDRRRAAPSYEMPPSPDPRPAILDVHRQLAERGIELIILPAPTKLSVHPEALAGELAGRPAEAPAIHNPSFATLRRELEAADVRFYDPVATLERAASGGTAGSEHAYLWTDSHWSPSGVDAVAAELADRVRALDLGFERQKVPWVRRTEWRRGTGDLARLLRFPAWGELYPEQPVRVERVTDAEGRPWASDRDAEVLLLGDSFTNVFSDPTLGWGDGAGLAEALAYHLRRPIDRLALNNAGASLGRERLAEELDAGRDRLAGKKIVVWEFAARELAIGDWRLISWRQQGREE